MAFSNFVAFNHFFDFENFHFQKTYENLVKNFFTFKIISLKMNLGMMTSLLGQSSNPKDSEVKRQTQVKVQGYLGAGFFIVGLL